LRQALRQAGANVAIDWAYRTPDGAGTISWPRLLNGTTTSRIVQIGGSSILNATPKARILPLRRNLNSTRLGDQIVNSSRVIQIGPTNASKSEQRAVALRRAPIIAAGWIAALLLLAPGLTSPFDKEMDARSCTWSEDVVRAGHWLLPLDIY